MTPIEIKIFEKQSLEKIFVIPTKKWKLKLKFNGLHIDNNDKNENVSIKTFLSKKNIQNPIIKKEM